MSGRGDGKRRGRPNRGGGRFNQRGGGRGRGRGGRGGGRGGKHHGGGFGGSDSRKGGAHAMADGYAGDAVLTGPAPQRPPRQTYRPSSYNPSNPRHTESKVTMQRLHMTSENQDMVRDMLKLLRETDETSSIEGDIEDAADYYGDEEEEEEEEYDELDWRADDQYWMTDSQLVVQDAASNVQFISSLDSKTSRNNSQKTAQQIQLVKNLGVSKLQRYGFEKGRCESALEAQEGDVGKALEHLLTQCFNLKPSVDGGGNSSTQANDGVDWEEIKEQRTEERMALESIYGDQFTEKIPNQVWTMSLELPRLTELSTKKTQKDKSSAPNKNIKPTWAGPAAEVCRFYRRGFCKFGTRCYNRHESTYKPTDSETQTQVDNDSTNMYTLEIRFPKGNKYPYETPYVAFYTTNPLMSSHACLNITAKLVEEAKEQSESSLPVVFSLVSILENEGELEMLYNQAPNLFSFPEPVLSRRQAAATKEPKSCEVIVNAEACGKNPRRADPLSEKRLLREEGIDGEGMKEEDSKQDLKKRYGKRDATKPIRPAHIDAANRKLKERFKKHQSQGGYQSMQKQRQRLPAWDKQREILAAIQQHQVTVVSGMTGCGKTTQVPQFILDSYLHGDHPDIGNIICTQPRRISAMAVAERVAEERVEKVGGIVGYQIRLESILSNQTRLLFCTTGILLRRLEGDALLQGVTHVIIDEVHERSEESDFLMMILRDVLPQRPDLRIVLMSATLNADLFSQYFDSCPVIDIPGRTYPVDQYFLEDAVECTGFIMEERSPYARPLKRANAVRGSSRPTVEEIDEDLESLNIQGAAPARDGIQDQNLSVKQLFVRYSEFKKSTVKALAIMDHEKINYDLIEALIEWIVGGQDQYPSGGAILVFLPGLAEITSLYENLLNNPVVGSRNKHKFRLIPLHSSLSSEDQHAVFSRPKEGVTKIVIATNIAETSITIEDVVYVIDAGRMKEKRYDSSKGMESLETVWVSRANALQRKGRAGRVASGVCFHLFTSHRFEHHLRDQPIPEIQRAPLEQIILKIKMLDIFKGMHTEEVLGRILEAPSEDSIQDSTHRLQDLGALNLQQGLTPLGYHLASLPVDVRIGKLMLFGAIFRCLDPALAIAATLSYKSPFVSPFDKRDDADKKKTEFAVGNSDHLTMLRAYKGWCTAQKNGSYAGYCYCQENFLSIKTLQMLASMKRQFTELLSDIGFVKEGLTTRRMERLGRDGSDGVLEASGPEANCNSENLKLVAAILVAALYPNVVQVMTPESKYSVSSGGAVPKAPKPEELKFKTKTDGYIHIHPSSVNFQVRHYESPYLVYHEMVKTSKVYVRDCTMVSVYPLLLFGGGSISVDLDRGNFVMSVDEGWIRFIAASHQIAELVRELRLELDQLLEDKIENPNMDLCTCPRGSKIINTIVKLITTQ